MTEMTVDTGHGIITGVDCYPANQRESDIILEHLKGQPCEYQEIGLGGGYDIGAVHRGLELLGIKYTAIREYQNNAMKKGFRYGEEKIILRLVDKFPRTNKPICSNSDINLCLLRRTASAQIRLHRSDYTVSRAFALSPSMRPVPDQMGYTAIP